jgi:Domain of unknown function (DUF4365)
MTTKRKASQGTSREGINFVRTLVERHNSTFQEIDLHNDLGNDAYVEFVVEECATGCCVTLQIKSGSSYRTASGGYAFQSDRDHFEYWASHTLPVVGIIFDPGTQSASWVDITNHLQQRPACVAEGPYTIVAEKEFSDAAFNDFREHCLRYRDQYSLEPNLGRALESMASLEDVERCFDGLRALFAYHRNRFVTWYYLISCVSNYHEHPVLRALVACLCHVPGHPDIFWHRENLIDEQVRKDASLLMRARFDHRDALTLLSAIDDAGVARGTIGQCVHVLVDMLADAKATMESIAVDSSLTVRVRHSAVLFAASAAQAQSVGEALSMVQRLRAMMSEGDEELAAVLSWLEEELRQHGHVAIY